MRFNFTKVDANQVSQKIMDELGGRELGKMVQISTEKGDLVVTISKFGTSKLVFGCKKTGDNLDVTLKEEKIALAHRAFKDDVKNKLVQVIEKVGGKVVS